MPSSRLYAAAAERRRVDVQAVGGESVRQRFGDERQRQDFKRSNFLERPFMVEIVKDQSPRDMSLEEALKRYPLTLWDLALARGIDPEAETWRDQNLQDHPARRDSSLLASMVRRDPVILTTLLPREEKVLRLTWGFDGAEITDRAHIAAIFGVTQERIRQIASKAERKLRHPRRLEVLLAGGERDLKYEVDKIRLPVSLRHVLSSLEKITPDLLQHLKRAARDTDLNELQPRVVEELVAELLASRGYEVSLVGQNPRTAADILALSRPDRLGVVQRFFIEVKRWRTRVGVEVIDRVHGALNAERDEIGWTAAMIVSVVGFRRFRRYPYSLLARRGIHLKDRDDLLQWLQDYTPHPSGLWLPRRSLSLDAALYWGLSEEGKDRPERELSNTKGAEPAPTPDGWRRR